MDPPQQRLVPQTPGQLDRLCEAGLGVVGRLPAELEVPQLAQQPGVSQPGVGSRRLTERPLHLLARSSQVSPADQQSGQALADIGAGLGMADHRSQLVQSLQVGVDPQGLLQRVLHAAHHQQRAGLLLEGLGVRGVVQRHAPVALRFP